MSVPKVVIVGRPNVGKSSVMNWQAGRLVSVVEPTAGVTRDRVTYLMHAGERYFDLVDTGGMGVEDMDDLTADVERQIEIGLAEASLIVFVVDGTEGVTPLDRLVAERLRKIDVRKLLVINKCDSSKTDAEIHQFEGLAPDAEMIQTSVKANRNRKELLQTIVANLPTAETDEAASGELQAAEPEMRLAIVGRRNVGKSTFINALAKTERMIVSEVAGTTRDMVDVRFELDEKSFIAIDTPGVRKRKSLANDMEYYGFVRAQKSIRRADMVLMFFDAVETISRVDMKLVDDIQSQDKPCIFVVNKWDLGLEKGMTSEKWAEYLAKTFSMMKYVPVAFVTAKDSRNIKQLVNLSQSIFKQSRTRVSTPRLNKALQKAIERNPPASKNGKRLKIFYATQVSTQPPTIVVKTNDPTLLNEGWKRYLLSSLREQLPFKEIPIRLYFRGRSEKDDPDEKPKKQKRGGKKIAKRKSRKANTIIDKTGSSSD
ncbi:GTPase Der [Caulifigura coniformis]|uniref:GTPase Der n=1 Tax=Caulifigura coniformis TaxID=2527983 RepID=A0A517SLJ3_9PLAN|nr:ribosome biogenesis GTPase Der [Caulifigura coniformis]QDT56992.1 GTPase Der [Caulifigura coniformis]